MKEITSEGFETVGWDREPSGGESGLDVDRKALIVKIAPEPRLPKGSLLLSVWTPDVKGGILVPSEMHAIIPPEFRGPAARKLRRLATFHRGQGRLGPEMEVHDELRAMEVLAKTLDALDEETAGRVLAWLTSRAQAADLKRLGRGAPPMRTGFATVDDEESVRIAKDRVTS